MVQHRAAPCANVGRPFKAILMTKHSPERAKYFSIGVWLHEQMMYEGINPKHNVHHSPHDIFLEMPCTLPERF